MKPYAKQFVRRNWQVLAALGLFAGFLIVHLAAFRPELARYQRAAGQAARLGMPLGGPPAAPVMSSRVTSLLTDNSLTAGIADEQSTSGALTAGLLGEVTQLAARQGLQVLSTEQGLVTQLPGSVVVRAHFRLSGSYAGFVGLMDGFARAQTLLTVERFELTGPATPGGNIEIWVSRLILKRTEARR